jgi:Ran GTPase-activating protein (RanGAP) involved in mRNA processing and transport
MGIGPSKAGLLAPALHQMSQLRDLDLSGNRMTKVGLRAIVGSLQAKPLEVLNLGGNTLKKGSAKTLKTLLPGLTVLRELVLDNNQFGKGAKLLAEALQNRSELTHLDLSRNGIGLSEMNLLVSGIASQTNLTKLGIGFNPLKDAGAVPLAIILRSLPALKALSVPGSQFSEAGACSIGGAIEGKALDFLDVSNQRKDFPGREVFGGVGVKHLVVGP